MGTDLVVARIQRNSLAQLPDNAQWEMRFEIRSESSNRLYIIARNKKSKKWGCSCPGYKRFRHCKHLNDGCGLDATQIHGADQLMSETSGRAAPVRKRLGR